MFPNQLFPPQIYPVDLFSRVPDGLNIVSFSNTIFLSQTVSPNIVANVSISQNATLTQSVNAAPRIITSNLSVTQTLFVNIVNLKSLISNIALTDTVHAVSLGQLVQQTLSIFADLTFVEHYEGIPPQHTANLIDTLSVTQTSSKAVSYAKSLSNNLIINDNLIISNAPHIISNIALTETIVSHINYTFSFIDHLVLIQTQQEAHFKFDSFSDNLTITQALIASKQKYRKLDDALVFTQNLTFDKFLHFTITNQINLTDGLVRKAQLTQSLSDTLLFKGGGGYGSGSPNAAKKGSSYFIYPDALPVLVHKYIILTGNTVIILPNPLFGDSRTNVAALNVNRMVNGSIYTYVKTTNKRQKLIYKFELRRQKSTELQKFIDDNDLLWLTLENWKGELWKVRITNNPVIFEATGRGYVCPENMEVHQVELEFQGILLSGAASSC